MQLKNKFSTTYRLFLNTYADGQKVSAETTKVKNLFGLITSSLVIETIFYLPNHFRQTVLVNSNKISFAKADDALLDLMNYMFKLNERTRTV